MDPLQQMAVQTAIDASNDPTVRQALTQYRASGVLPQNEAALFALRAAYLSHGLPAPTMAAATGTPQAGHSVDPNAPRPIATPPPNSGDNSDPTMGFGPNRGGAQGVLPQTPTNSAPTPGYTPPDVMYAASQAGAGMGAGVTTGAGAARTAENGVPAQNPVQTTPVSTVATPSPAGGTNVSANPAAAPGAATAGGQIDPSLFYGRDNQPAQQALFNQMLLKLGVDPTNPGLFGGAIMKRLMPIFDNMQTVGGLGAGKTWAADPLGGMNELAGVLQTKGVSGLQDIGNAVLANIHNLQGNNDPKQQMAIQDAALGLSAEAMNPYMSQGLAQQSANARTLFGLAGAVGPDGKMEGLPTNYLDYISRRNDNGAYRGLLDLLNGGR